MSECGHTRTTYDIRAHTDKCYDCKKHLRRAYWQKACPKCATWVSRFVAEQRMKRHTPLRVKVTCWHCGTDVTDSEMREVAEEWV
jgi:hypothetical protein